MPTVIRAHGLRFAVFTDDHSPPHVHVSGRGAAKIGLGSEARVIAIQGMSRPDIARARSVVRDNHERLLEVWDRIHG